MQSLLPSPAVSIVGRHNSGKTTLVVKLIEELVSRGLDVGSIKHHSHAGFEIDIPGKDSYRHHHAGTSETIIASPGQVAVVKDIQGELECAELVRMMPGHDIVIVEGYRKSGLPAIEIMRSGNKADMQVAQAFSQASLDGVSLGADFVQVSRGDRAHHQSLSGISTQRRSTAQSSLKVPADIAEKMPTQATVAVVTDIALAQQAAQRYGIPCFGLDDVAAISDFIQQTFTRQRLSVVIQAGGESRRMGRSKATVPFLGRPLIMRLVERMLPIADELIITTNEAPELAFLHDEFPQANIRLVPDLLDYRGALPGLLTALEAATYDYVALVACDMIFASPNLVAEECARMSLSGADVVVPINNHGFEPFHALYRVSGCLDAVKAKLEEGDKRAQAFFEQVNVLQLPHEDVLKAEPLGGCFINANTPEELAYIEQNFFSD